MGRKNAFLTKIQKKHEREEKTAIMLAEKWTRQAALDALVLLLGYGEIMGKDSWGMKRIERAANEWTTLFLWILRGAQGSPDSDAIREQVDRLLKPKVTPELYRVWEERYPNWITETLEEEVQRLRPGWKREGDLEKDTVTSDLLKGIGKAEGDA